MSALGGLLLSAGPALAAGGPIMPLSQVHAGMDCTGETVVQGTTISSFNVHVMDVVQDPIEGPRILINVSGPVVDRTGVAEGYSGSPILCDDGSGTMRNIGAISESIGEYGDKVALATPIQQMLGEPVSPPSSAPRLSVRGRPLRGPLTIGGLSPSLLALVQRGAQRAGRTIVAAPSGSSLSFPVQNLVPGASVATQYSTGTVAIGAIGTVTYRDGNVVYAFGHPLDEVGRRALVLTDAYIYYVVNNPIGLEAVSYKLGVPGHAEGTLSSDTPNAVVGTVGAQPPLTRVNVVARDLDTGRAISEPTQIADETNIGDPLGSSLLGLVAPLAVAQAGTDVYNGAPSGETGRMCLSVKLREAHQPFQFCNRYVTGGLPGGGGLGLPPALALLGASDVTTALGLLDTETFAQLHVTRVNVHLDAGRGQHQATILGARGPARARAGSLVKVKLKIQRYRGATRTLALRVRIPRNAVGRVTVKLSGGGALASPDALSNALSNALFGIGFSFGGPTPKPPNSLKALRKQFERVGSYDGLQGRIGHRKAKHLYRDPSLLITGQAKLHLLVTP
ncbi:MAG: hypothetical protein ACJ76X_09735 [Solirubrobacteraceae bacterium]